jgi:hypothetical protein
MKWFASKPHVPLEGSIRAIAFSSLIEENPMMDVKLTHY